MRLTPSNHAKKRCQQRAIRPEIASLIYAYGTASRSWDVTRYTLDGEALNWARRELATSQIDTLQRFDGAYLIISDEAILITAVRHSRSTYH